MNEPPRQSESDLREFVARRTASALRRQSALELHRRLEAERAGEPLPMRRFLALLAKLLAVVLLVALVALALRGWLLAG